jgi:hypothetical protein
MVSVAQFRELALSFTEAVESPHFEKASFRIRRKVFATLDESAHRACLKLTEREQDLFCLFDRTVMYPVPNKFGKQGWTFVALPLIELETLHDALRAAYCATAPGALRRLYETPASE